MFEGVNNSVQRGQGVDPSSIPALSEVKATSSAAFAAESEFLMHNVGLNGTDLLRPLSESISHATGAFYQDLSLGMDHTRDSLTKISNDLGNVVQQVGNNVANATTELVNSVSHTTAAFYNDAHLSASFGLENMRKAWFDAGNHLNKALNQVKGLGDTLIHGTGIAAPLIAASIGLGVFKMVLAKTGLIEDEQFSFAKAA